MSATTTAPEPPRPSGRRRLAAAALGLVLAAGAADIVLRATGAGVWRPRDAHYNMYMNRGEPFLRLNPRNPPTHAWDGDPYGTLPPGAKMTYEINEAGLRGPLPEPGKSTVLVMGDSFTFGEGVALENTFTARLSRAYPSGPTFVNAGVSGYGTREEAARLPSEIERFKPTAVLLVFVANDATPLTDSIDQVDDLITRGRPVADQPTGLPALVSRILSRSRGDDAVIEWQLSYYTGARRKNWEVTRAALGSMNSVARARGIPFGVAFFPLLDRVHDRPFAPVHDALADACREFGVPCVDLSAAFDGVADWKLWIHPTDHHPSPLAHERAADALKPFVASLLR
ncbi:MAG: hypothetical protein K8T90_16985 [Planctomycetes bacterium]|nr:hypothetical protein [Planctomycetota bacterium]